MYSMTLRRDILTCKNVDGRLFHADMWAHILALNKLRSSSVYNKSPLPGAEKNFIKKDRKYKKHRQIRSGYPATQI
jgi:hypothetical protein